MRTMLLAGILTLALASAFGGCGDGGGSDFDKCGNGAVDSGEECDDGNLLDTDACLSTCRANVCGDGFVDRAHEECDGLNPTCDTLGLGQGFTNCLASCTLDTSGCRAVGNPTPTGVVGTPTPAPTPVGSVCTGTEQIVVTVALDADVTSATLNLAYDTSINVPGSGTDSAVKDRVDFTGTGLTAVNDFDGNDDLVDDTLTVTLVGSDVVPAGPFATVAFDCVVGQPVPTAGDLTCTASASLNETPVDAICSVSIQ
ncbi:MAG: hypothetical protein ABIR79_03075 [Candidatus Binatia bacterium]